MSTPFGACYVIEKAIPLEEKHGHWQMCIRDRASTWQQFGRAGRSNAPSVAVLVGNSSPLNQFMIQNPEYFLGRGAEFARINPNNLYILVSHLKCAAFELPFAVGEQFGDLSLIHILDEVEK